MKILNGEKSRFKSFVGGGIIFGILGLLIGGFIMSAVLCTAFINYSLSHTTCMSASFNP